VLPAAAHGDKARSCARGTGCPVSNSPTAHGVHLPRVRIAAVVPPCSAPPLPPQVLVLSRGPGFPRLCPASRVCSPRAQSFSAPCPPLRLGFNGSSRTAAVVFWLGFWFWWEHPGAEMGRLFASMAVVGTWGTSHQVGWSVEARGSRGGAPGGAALTFAPGRAAGAVFFSGGFTQR
jgi:hypothetical protein